MGVRTGLSGSSQQGTFTNSIQIPTDPQTTSTNSPRKTLTWARHSRAVAEEIRGDLNRSANLESRHMMPSPSHFDIAKKLSPLSFGTGFEAEKLHASIPSSRVNGGAATLAWR
eukprot:31341-Pelagococcus_subviridis.AAC.3